jgi:hypothetical protein
LLWAACIWTGVSGATIALAAQSEAAEEIEIIRAWRRDPDGLKMVRDEDSGLDISEWHEHEWPAETEVAPPTAVAAAPKKLSEGTKQQKDSPKKTKEASKVSKMAASTALMPPSLKRAGESHKAV